MVNARREDGLELVEDEVDGVGLLEEEALCRSAGQAVRHRRKSSRSILSVNGRIDGTGLRLRK